MLGEFIRRACTRIFVVKLTFESSHFIHFVNFKISICTCFKFELAFQRYLETSSSLPALSWDCTVYLNSRSRCVIFKILLIKSAKNFCYLTLLTFPF